ncbi:MAG: ATP-binding protein [Alphaproteobacteria bacterium]|nr:ATP-binding protein [Alphaproteobacteria bacterium]
MPQSKNKANAIAKEYEEFAYIVSHDLNAPLRHIREFTRLLIDARANPSKEEKEYIGFLEISLRRLDQMQQALLTFSRLNTRAAPLREIDCNVALRATLDNLIGTINAKKAKIEIDTLPTIIAEPHQFQLLLFFLIDNALKFCTELPPHLQIRANKEEKRFVFEVRDHGIGIPAPYHKEVFKFFRRLHTGDRYPGIGAGLTLAQKIVHRHGGEIWIESPPQGGTSVIFTCPRSAPEASAGADL